MTKTKRGRGRPRKFDDSLHRYWRKHHQKYYENHREEILLGKKLQVSVAEARRILEKRKRRGEK